MVTQLLAFMALCGGVSWAGDINRQSIVFHEETPDVFYCPQEKPISLEGIHFVFLKCSLNKINSY